MPKRRGIRRVDSLAIQGEESWVEVDSLTVKEVKDMRKRSRDDEEYDNFDAGIELVKKHVINWNWVDYDGVSMPAPKTYNAIVETLTVEEINFLADALMGEDKTPKDSPTE